MIKNLWTKFQTLAPTRSLNLPVYPLCNGLLPPIRELRKTAQTLALVDLVALHLWPQSWKERSRRVPPGSGGVVGRSRRAGVGAGGGGFGEEFWWERMR